MKRSFIRFKSRARKTLLWIETLPKIYFYLISYLLSVVGVWSYFSYVDLETSYLFREAHRDLLRVYEQEQHLQMVGTWIVLAIVFWQFYRLRTQKEEIDTERKALKAERDLFVGGPAVVFVWTAQSGWVVEYASANAKEVFGYDAQEMMESQFQFASLVHPDDFKMVSREVGQYLHEKKASYEQSYRVRLSDGTYGWFYDFTVPEYDEHGIPVKFRGYLVDQSLVKETQGALAKEKQRLKDIIAGTNVGMWEWNLHSHDVVICKQWASMGGYDLGELAPMTLSRWKNMIHPEDRERVVRSMNDHISGVYDHYECEMRVRHKSGEWIWVHDRGRVSTYDSEGKALWMTGTRADITNRKRAEEQVHHLAFYDVLTGLPNRRLLLDRLKQKLYASSRSGEYGALLFLDLDHFKVLNDTQGHDVGDQLLVEVSKRIVSLLRDGDTVARLGGDEFVVVIDQLGFEASGAMIQAEGVAQKICAHVRAPYDLGGRRNILYETSVTIGVSLFKDYGVSLDDLLKQADIALYEAKAAGRNTVKFFNTSMQEVIAEKVFFEKELRKALDNKELHVFYQPQVDKNGVVIGAEALARWKHPTMGFVSPAKFITIAEETGVIIPLGWWILEQVCRDVAMWMSLDPHYNGVISVNMSVKQFRQLGFVEGVEQIITQSGVKPSFIKIELTEGIAVDNIEETIHKMERLRAYGVTFALDDFGTGYSSLAYLKRLPLSQLKIDQSFVRDIVHDSNDAVIVQATIAMGRSLGLAVIAEGVETIDQKNFLEENHCFEYQGYLFCPPVPQEEMTHLLKGSVTLFRP